MAEISRLRDSEISNGNLINADDIDTELNQLVDESNSQHDRLTILESGPISLSGVKTFLTAPKLDAIEERTTGQGVTVESVTLRQGALSLRARIRIAGVDVSSNQLTTNMIHNLTTAQAVEMITDNTLPSPLSDNTVYYVRVIDSDSITLHPSSADAIANANAVNITTTGTGNHALLGNPASPIEGELWYNKAEEKLKIRTSLGNKNLLVEEDGGRLPKGFLSGIGPQYVSAASVQIPINFLCRDKDDTYNLEFNSAQTVSLASSGANGLDNGSEASNTWYYLYAIGDSSGVNSPKGIFSAVNESVSGSVTMPSGYDKKRQLPIAIRNDASSNIIPYTIRRWGSMTEIKYQVLQAGGGDTVGPTNVLDGGTATSYTSVSLASFVPPLSKLATVRYQHSVSASASVIYLRPAGASGDYLVCKQDWDRYSGEIVEIEISTSQALEYKVSGSAILDLSVWGYIVTEAV